MTRPADASLKNAGIFQLAFGATLLVTVFLLAISIDRTQAKFPPMPDFGSYAQVDDMKAAFIDYLTPIIRHYNAKILQDRKRLQRLSTFIDQGGNLSRADSKWLQQLAERYEVDWAEDKRDEAILRLKRRVDIIPAPLVLVQAAKESSWGQSRFAVEGRNLFGQWCFDEGCGIKPRQSPAGAKHEVRRFNTASDSVRSYLRNLNTHDGYRELRGMRQQLRENNQPITAKALADGLSSYSQLRETYVKEVKVMIAQYHRFQRIRAE